MTKKTKLQTGTSNSSPFYSPKGILLLILLVSVLSAFALWGMYAIGVIRLPAGISALFAEETVAPRPAGAAQNIAPEPEEATLLEAIPREEYALALADMAIPYAYYRNYKIKIFSDTKVNETEYFVVKDGKRWWVQTQVDNVILSTVSCQNGTVTITDNAQNASVTAKEFSAASPSGISFEERCGILSLQQLTEIIRAVASGESVEYGGGVRDYSLSYTPSRGTSDNVFTFAFACENGIAEEYTFAYESAVILSATKTYGEKTIYKMELKDYRNELTDIPTDTLFAAP